MKKQVRGMNNPTRKAGGLRRALLALVVLLVALTFFVGAGSAATLPTSGAVSSGEYQLTGDVTLTGILTIASGEIVVIDLNGYSLSLESKTLVSIIQNEGTLTIKDSSDAGTGEIKFICSKSTTAMYGINNNGGTLNFASGKITITRTAGTSTVHGIYSGTIKMTGGELVVSATSQVSTVNGISSSGTISAGRVTVSTAKSSGTANVVSNSNTVISGGTFSGKTVSAKVTGGTFNFNPTTVGANIPAYFYQVIETNGAWTVSSVAEADLPKNIDVDGAQYATFESAKDAIVSGSTVKLIENYDGGKASISLPAGVTLDLNGKTLTLDKSVVLSFTGGTETQPTKITDSQATSHDNAGTIKALMKIGSGYTTFEKVNVDTTATEKLNTFTITGTSANKAYVTLSGITVKTAGSVISTSNGDFTSKYADITIQNIDETFGFTMNSEYKYASTNHYHKIFQNEDQTTVTIESGTFTTTESGTNHKVYFAYNDERSSSLYIKGGDFSFKNGNTEVTDVFLMWNRYANDAKVTGGKFQTDSSSIGTTGFSGLIPTTIQGGIFNVEPSATAFATGYFATENTDETTKTTYKWTVGFEAAVKVGDTKYPGIQEAFDAMAAGTETGREIVLLKDIVLGNALSVQVDGVTITTGTNTLTLPTDKAAVTLENGVNMPAGIDTSTFEAYRGTSTKHYYSSFATAAKSAGTITLLKDVTLKDTTYFFYNTADCTLNLGDYTLTSNYNGSSYPGLFTVAGSVMDGATLTVNADAGGIVANNAYTFHVGTGHAGHLVINEGNFYGQVTSVNVQTGSVIINGGTFNVANPSFTINCIDDNYKAGTATVSISGGTFHNFDPGNNAAEGAGTSFLKEGCESRDNGDSTYTVIDPSAITYDLTWDFDGGTTTATDYTPNGSYADGAAITYPADNTMSKEGHTFAGWNETRTAMPAEPMTIKALWTENPPGTYALTWDFDGGVTTSTDYTPNGGIAEGTTIIYPADSTMIKDGYTFAGWNETRTTMPAEPMTIKALWTEDVPDQPVTPDIPDTPDTSSTPQGSSVWLTETPTQTPTQTPSEQPTDVAPTDIPTTQPSTTQTPESPGFGVLAVLGALGAVAVLRRK